jgi:hypothetical protein
MRCLISQGDPLCQQKCLLATTKRVERGQPSESAGVRRGGVRSVCVRGGGRRPKTMASNLHRADYRVLSDLVLVGCRLYQSKCVPARCSGRVFYELPNSTLQTFARQHDNSTVVDEPFKIFVCMNRS